MNLKQSKFRFLFSQEWQFQLNFVAERQKTLFIYYACIILARYVYFLGLKKIAPNSRIISIHKLGVIVLKGKCL